MHPPSSILHPGFDHDHDFNDYHDIDLDDYHHGDLDDYQNM